MPVARDFHVDERKTDSFMLASRLVDLLSDASIEARQRSYEWHDVPTASMYSVRVRVENRVAVLVDHRDRERASEVTIAFGHELEREQTARERALASATYDDGLTQAALKARKQPEA